MPLGACWHALRTAASAARNRPAIRLPSADVLATMRAALLHDAPTCVCFLSLHNWRIHLNLKEILTMKAFIQATVLAFAALFSLTSQAHSAEAGELTIIHPNAKPTRPGVLSSAAYFGVQNKGSDEDKILSVRSDVAKHTEIHDMKMENDVMRMFKVDGVSIPAGQTLTLGKDNKLHVMLMELKEPLKVGDKFTLTITFEKAGEVPVEVWVEEPKAADAAAAGHEGH
ncbi:copper chaperone PCu(A)C [Lampropedia aestuarii]|uniref:Copper chaperone PCu(A)C n=2 Tax=Lampropedia aestuarii TaxID=2562762 RepID=A0A4V3YX22_9BURK|nr:copper chaperone PCu(A)C [Lampropedia aestuarii]